MTDRFPFTASVDIAGISRRRFLAGASGWVAVACGQELSGDTHQTSGATQVAEGGAPAACSGERWASEDVPPAKKLEPFTQVIPGSEVVLEMLSIPGGVSTMTDPYGGGIRRVTIQPFWMLKTEVTWDAYSLFAYGHPLCDGFREFASVYDVDAVTRPTDPYLPPGPDHRHWGRQDEPAIRITYFAAVRFCLWLSEKTGRKYRLPTEPEWEYACRAGAPPETLPADESDEAALDKVAWYFDNADDRPQPVATKAPNAWGLYDMLGNVAEWCVGLGDQPVVRGGSFDDPPEKIRPDRREYYRPQWQERDYQDPKSRWWLVDAPHVGFRLACEPPT